MLRKYLVVAALASVVISFTERAAAFNIVFNNPSEQDYIVGINDLQIGEGKYDVHFVSGTFVGVFGDPTSAGFPPSTLPFWGSSDQTVTAVSQIVGALNTVATQSACVNPIQPPYCPFFIPFATDPEQTAVALAGMRSFETDYQQYQVGALQGTSYSNRTYALINRKLKPSLMFDCKNGGWKAFGFKNQGQCIQYVNTGK